MNIKSILKEPYQKVITTVGVIILVLLASSIVINKSCRGGYESPAYVKLKAKFDTYKAESEAAYSAMEETDAVTKKENTGLRAEVDKLEISQGLALADVADVRKEIFEKDQELDDLREREAELGDLPELVVNLRAQIFTLQGKITLKDQVEEGLLGALQASNGQVSKLEGIIFNKDQLIDGPKGLRVALAAERVARMAAEAAMAVGEKKTFGYKLGKLVGNGFKLYGMYSAGRDIIGAGK